MIGALRASGAAVPPDLGAQLGELVALRQDIASARPSDLLGLAQAVAALAASTAASERLAQSASADRSAATLDEAVGAGQKAVQSAMDYARGASLRFTSQDDERGYREREAEREAYLRAQQAKETPEGQLNANAAALGQLADARAHGASGPEFDHRWHELAGSTDKLREAIRAKGGSTQEFDERLRDDLRRIMKSKGLSNAEIDTRFAAQPDPLEAAKAFVADKDMTSVRHSVDREAWRMDGATVVKADPPPSASSPDDPFAKLRAAGVTANSHDVDADCSHGITASPMKSGTVRGRV